MDYVIVGSGIYGSLVAWELAQAGAGVQLLEADQTAAGASGGIGKRGVRANGRDVRELPLMRMAYERWPSLHEELGGETGFVRCGHLQLIERDRDYLEVEARLWLQRTHGIETELLQADQVHAQEPALNPDIQAALFCPLDGVADHTATTLSAAEAARQAGADIRTGFSVAEIQQSSGRATGVITTDGEEFSADRGVILLSNSSVPHLLQASLGLYLPVWSRYPQVIITGAIPGVTLNHLIGHAHRRLAMKNGPDGSIMISGGWLGKAGPNGRGRPVTDQVAGNWQEAVAVLPALADATIAAVQADRLESQSVDHIPIIDHAPGLDNLYYATGWSGHGWAIAPAVSRLLAEWILSGRKPEALEPFRFSRF
ncbi:MAG: FAD-binding oxidoreductase [Caldilineaceae bacterium]|nr:FAD-binding oxidoreductase [Caldilineaceae bacterium]